MATDQRTNISQCQIMSLCGTCTEAGVHAGIREQTYPNVKLL
jgi:hydrogenase maturation factor